MRPFVMRRHAAMSVFAIALAMAVSGAAVEAAAQTPLDRFTIIAGGWQLERQCEHLDAGARDTFGQIVAHAEIDMAGKYGAKKVKQVLDAADQFGQEMGAACGDETGRAVSSSFAVARQYAEERTAAVAEADAAKRQVKRKKAQRRKTARAQTPAQAKARPDLQRFGAQTKAYYLQRRCGHLSYKNDLAFWKLIARRHHALIRRYGAGAVGRVERRAKASAYNGALRCGAGTRRMVLSGRDAIRRDVTRD